MGCGVVWVGNIFWALLRRWEKDGTKLPSVKPLVPAFELALHIILGAGLFALIVGAAAGLNYLLAYCEANHLAPEWIVGAMHVMEAVLWAADLLAFSIFTLIQMYRFGFAMWREAKAVRAEA